MSENVYKLNPKQWLVIDSLSKGQSYEQACRTASVTKTTISRWQKLADFRDALEEATQTYRKTVHEDAIHVIRDSTDKLGKRMYAMADKMGNILDEWLSIRSAEEMKDSDVIRMMEVFNTYSERSLALQDKAWSIDSLLESLEDKE